MATLPSSQSNAYSVHPPGAPPPRCLPTSSPVASSPPPATHSIPPPHSGCATNVPTALHAPLPDRLAPSNNPDTSSPCACRDKLILLHPAARTLPAPPATIPATT